MIALYFQIFDYYNHFGRELQYLEHACNPSTQEPEEDHTFLTNVCVCTCLSLCLPACSIYLCVDVQEKVSSVSPLWHLGIKLRLSGLAARAFAL